MAHIDVQVRSCDRITSAGLVNYLQPHDQIRVVESGESDHLDVLVVAVDRITPAGLRRLIGPQAADQAAPPSVLVVDEVSHEELLIAINAGVVGVLPRSVITAERLQHAIAVAAIGGAVMPNDLLGVLISHCRRLQREALVSNGLSGLGFTARETEVLRLMADGLDTGEVAARMAYSERTIKGIVSSAAKRLNLRNRTHAVAYACRSGVI